MHHAQLFLGSRKNSWTLDISFNPGEKFRQMELVAIAINAVVIERADRRGISEEVICGDPELMRSIRTHAVTRVAGFARRYPNLMEK